MHGSRIQATDLEAIAAAAVGLGLGGVDECGYDEIADTARAGGRAVDAIDQLLGADAGLDLEPDIAALAVRVDDVYDAIEPGSEGGIGQSFRKGDTIGHGWAFSDGHGGGVDRDAVGGHDLLIRVQTGLDVLHGYALATAAGEVLGG